MHLPDDLICFYLKILIFIAFQFEFALLFLYEYVSESLYYRKGLVDHPPTELPRSFTSVHYHRDAGFLHTDDLFIYLFILMLR